MKQACATKKTLWCNFCQRSEHDVAQLIVGPLNVGICNECVALAVATMSEAISTADRQEAKGQ